MRKVFLILVFLFSYPENSFASNHYPITRDSEINIFKGKKLYKQYCASCHQSNLSGAVNWKSLDNDGHRKAPPLNGTGHTWHHSDEILHKIIKYGLAKLVKNYEGKMYGYGDKIDDQGIDNILSYIKSYWNEENYKYQINLSKK
ncbi:MAG: cytochrome c [Candidatus Pelagibacterales bacterium]|nr:MAG: cytochrome c [Pelagibacterales bacterium]|tara:strand:- start:113 stop:544 length:432 start_codon:yes stop_codon:yes gene_type:complete